MYTVANNVRATLNTGINSSVTSIIINNAVSPFNNPATPVSGFPGVITLTDSLGAPTKFEIVTYTGITDNGNGTRTLTGVVRGVESSTAQAWTSGQFLYQSATAALLCGNAKFPQVECDGLEVFGQTTTDDLTVNNDVGVDGYVSAYRGFVLGPEENLGNSGAGISIDWAGQKAKRVTVSANTTLTFSTAPQGPCMNFLKVITDATNGATYTIAWPASVKWVGGAIPNHRTGNSHTHLFELFYDGTNYLGSAKLNFS